MRVFRNESIDRLMARRMERNLKSGEFGGYLADYINNKNYGFSSPFGGFGSFGGFGTNMGFGFPNMSNSSNIFDALNTNTNSTGFGSFGFSYETLKAVRDLQNKQIGKKLESGEPLRGVSYNEFMTYYLEKNGTVDLKTMQLYKQAVKGDAAALKAKQWRTDPDYIIPERLYGDPAILADRDAALEKAAKNEKLEDWEQRLLDTLSEKK